MKFFTRAWANGELSDEDAEAIRGSYQMYLDNLVPKLPETLKSLAIGDPSLHDGLIHKVIIDTGANSLEFILCCGDLQTGYFDVDLVYSGVDWSVLDIQALKRRARDPETEILYDEVGQVAEGVYEHRILFWPEDEISIRFSRLERTTKPRSDQADRSGKDLAEDPVVVVGNGDVG